MGPPALDGHSPSRYIFSRQAFERCQSGLSAESPFSGFTIDRNPGWRMIGLRLSARRNRSAWIGVSKSIHCADGPGHTPIKRTRDYSAISNGCENIPKSVVCQIGHTGIARRQERLSKYLVLRQTASWSWARWASIPRCPSRRNDRCTSNTSRVFAELWKK